MHADPGVAAGRVEGAGGGGAEPDARGAQGLHRRVLRLPNRHGAPRKPCLRSVSFSWSAAMYALQRFVPDRSFDPYHNDIKMAVMWRTLPPHRALPKHGPCRVAALQMVCARAASVQLPVMQMLTPPVSAMQAKVSCDIALKLRALCADGERAADDHADAADAEQQWPRSRERHAPQLPHQSRPRRRRPPPQAPRLHPQPGTCLVWLFLLCFGVLLCSPQLARSAVQAALAVQRASAMRHVSRTETHGTAAGCSSIKSIILIPTGFLFLTLRLTYRLYSYFNTYKIVNNI